MEIESNDTGFRQLHQDTGNFLLKESLEGETRQLLTFSWTKKTFFFLEGNKICSSNQEALLAQLAKKESCLEYEEMGEVFGAKGLLISQDEETLFVFTKREVVALKLDKSPKESEILLAVEHLIKKILEKNNEIVIQLETGKVIKYQQETKELFEVGSATHWVLLENSDVVAAQERTLTRYKEGLPQTCIFDCDISDLVLAGDNLLVFVTKLVGEKTIEKIHLVDAVTFEKKSELRNPCSSKTDHSVLPCGRFFVLGARKCSEFFLCDFSTVPPKILLSDETRIAQLPFSANFTELFPLSLVVSEKNEVTPLLSILVTDGRFCVFEIQLEKGKKLPKPSMNLVEEAKIKDKKTNTRKITCEREEQLLFLAVQKQMAALSSFLKENLSDIQRINKMLLREQKDLETETLLQKISQERETINSCLWEVEKNNKNSRVQISVLKATQRDANLLEKVPSVWDVVLKQTEVLLAEIVALRASIKHKEDATDELQKAFETLSLVATRKSVITLNEQPEETRKEEVFLRQTETGSAKLKNFKLENLLEQQPERIKREPGDKWLGLSERQTDIFEWPEFSGLLAEQMETQRPNNVYNMAGLLETTKLETEKIAAQRGESTVEDEQQSSNKELPKKEETLVDYTMEPVQSEEFHTIDTFITSTFESQSELKELEPQTPSPAPMHQYSQAQPFLFGSTGLPQRSLKPAEFNEGSFGFTTQGNPSFASMAAEERQKEEKKTLKPSFLNFR